MYTACTPPAIMNIPNATRPRFRLLRSMDESEPLEDFAPVFCSGSSPGMKSRLSTGVDAGTVTGVDVDVEGASAGAVGFGDGGGFAGLLLELRPLLEASVRTASDGPNAPWRRAPRVSTENIFEAWSSCQTVTKVDKRNSSLRPNLGHAHVILFGPHDDGF